MPNAVLLLAVLAHLCAQLESNFLVSLAQTRVRQSLPSAAGGSRSKPQGAFFVSFTRRMPKEVLAWRAFHAWQEKRTMSWPLR